jgi:hypothetical protein
MSEFKWTDALVDEFIQFAIAPGSRVWVQGHIKSFKEKHSHPKPKWEILEAKGGYMVKGHDGNGNKLNALVGEEKALAAIKAGVAKQGW